MIQVTNILTLIIVAAWIISSVVRRWVSWPEAAILDAAMPVVISYWFAAKAMTKKNGHAENGAAS